MNDLAKNIDRILKEKDLSKAALGRLLGDYSGQLIGQYIKGKHKPKTEFFERWKEVFGEDIYERNVSHETFNPTQEMKESEKIEYLNRIIEEKEKRIQDLKELMLKQDGHIEALKESIAFLKENLSIRTAMGAEKAVYR